MKERKYDIFISYRRAGGAQYARILQLMLTQRGYRVFLDYDELKDGNFSEKIKKAITEAPVFMMVLSSKAMVRCAEKDDWVRQEIMTAIVEGKHIIPVDPDHSFDGIPKDIPVEIKDAIGHNQHSEINFGQALGVTVDLMIKDRLVPSLGPRTASGSLDTEFDAAKETLKKLDAHHRFMKRLGLAGVAIVVLIVLLVCLGRWNHLKEKERIDKERTELEKKYNGFPLYLSQNLTINQMETIDDILGKMAPVRPDTLWMSQFEFTMGQWYGITGETYDASQKDLPMTDVSFGEIYLFIINLRDITNISFALPSVEQWEYAAHSGRHRDTTLYVGSDDVDDVAWYQDNSGGRSHPSNGQQGKNPNKLDLYDMSGNVSELCNTPFVSDASNTPYTACGGNFNSPASQVTVSSKKGVEPDAKDHTVGFRLIIDKQQP